MYGTKNTKKKPPKQPPTPHNQNHKKQKNIPLRPLCFVHLSIQLLPRFEDSINFSPIFSLLDFLSPHFLVPLVIVILFICFSTDVLFFFFIVTPYGATNKPPLLQTTRPIGEKYYLDSFVFPSFLDFLIFLLTDFP